MTAALLVRIDDAVVGRLWLDEMINRLVILEMMWQIACMERKPILHYRLPTAFILTYSRRTKCL